MTCIRSVFLFSGRSDEYRPSIAERGSASASSDSGSGAIFFLKSSKLSFRLKLSRVFMHAPLLSQIPRSSNRLLAQLLPALLNASEQFLQPTLSLRSEYLRRRFTG